MPQTLVPVARQEPWEPLCSAGSHWPSSLGLPQLRQSPLLLWQGTRGANEPHRQPIVAGFHVLFHTEKLTDVFISESPFVSSSCMQNRRGIGGRQGVHMRIKIPTLGKGLTQHWGSASIAAPIAPAAVGCTQLHGFRGREILQAQGNSKQLKRISTTRNAERREERQQGEGGWGANPSAGVRTMRSMGAPHTARSLS